MMKKFLLLFIILCSHIMASPPVKNITQQIVSWKDVHNQINVVTTDGNLYIIPLANNIVRVKFQKEVYYKLPELVYVDNHHSIPGYRVTESPKEIIVNLKGMSVSINKLTGRLSFFNSKKERVLVEGQRNLSTTSVQGMNTYCAEQHFKSLQDEYLYGLGQFQDGYLNVRGLSRRLTQVNTQISVPFILSNKGYGILWNNYGLTEYNPSDNKILFQKSNQSEDKVTVAVTSTEGTKMETRENNAFTAVLDVPQKGKYSLLLDVGQKMARNYHLEIDGKEVLDMRSFWLPPTASVIVEMNAGRHILTAKLEKDDKPVLYYKLVQDETVFRSPVAESVDYTAFVGNADQVIAGYRAVTGEVPMMPRWALGYIHCRERFHSQKELLETAQKFRSEQIPMDVIVQDWQYWGKYGWNAMRFDEADYPDPKSMVDQLHQMNARLMVSVWSKIDPQSEVGKQMSEKGYYIPNTSWIDFFNPQAASFYWKNFSERLLKPYGIDAWWQDATEPENDDLVGRKVLNGQMPGEVYRDIYPLLVNKTVYEGCRHDDPSRRTMILTRSGFSGIQKYGVATWSGDIGNDWETLRRQITAGLGLMATGLPWWTYDAGGFFRPGNQYTDKLYHERFLRWFQIGTFLPLLRVHGYMTDTEFWKYGEDVTRIARISLNLRYRLLPYTYSEAANVSFKGSTLMRPLVMDFVKDTIALSQKYEFMFGPSLLVAPIVKENPKTWNVYLPGNKGGWYDFWNGERHQGGNYLKTDVTLEHIPLFVKAGTILPLGKEGQYADDSVNSPWEVRVYPGANGEYTLYEDEGNNYNYEKGLYSTIRLTWNDSKRELTFYPRLGKYPGMCVKRLIKVVKVDKSNGIGVGETSSVQKEIVYEGQKITIKLE